MLSNLWSKFFLNKFLQNFPDIITFRIHYNVCIILVSFDYVNHEIILYLSLQSWNIQFELTVLELIFRASSHLGGVELWYHIGCIWLFQSRNHMVFIETFIVIFCLNSSLRKYIESSGHHQILHPCKFWTRYSFLKNSKTCFWGMSVIIRIG